MSKVALVSCAAGKLSEAAPASQLYQSNLFRLARRYAEKTCDRWFILSAKHHLLRADTRIEPYDLTLNAMRIADRRKWAEIVFQQLKKELKPKEKVIILAGEKYREFLVPAMVEGAIAFEVPMEHLAIGMQQKWLKEQGL